MRASGAGNPPPVNRRSDDPPAVGPEPRRIVEAALGEARRVLLLGAPGVGKSTLTRALAAALTEGPAAPGRCFALSADPGSPLFGVPGALCLGQWCDGAWRLLEMEALCTLDAGRFRLPLAQAVRRLAGTAPTPLLVDAPGVVRGVAGAELLTAIVEAAAIDTVLVLTREGRPLPLAGELRALGRAVYRVPAAPAAQRPGKAVRARRRTALWDAHLEHAQPQSLQAGAVHLVGTPPPLDAPAAWRGRQVALLEGTRTRVLGEAETLAEGVLHLRLAGRALPGAVLLVRDAQRREDGRLHSAAPFTADPLAYLPAPEMAPEGYPTAAGPRPVGRVGSLDFALVNGVFGDPLLHLRLRHRRRSLLFDLGEGSRLPARVAHQVSDVFISHAHIDHIGGFLWLLRSRIGEPGMCRLFGPPGLAGNIEGLVRGILWDRIGERGPLFMVSELHGETLRRFQVRAGGPGCESLDPAPAPDGLLLEEPEFRVRAATLDHDTPVLAFALEPAAQLNVRKERLQARGLGPGPWLGELKRRVREQALGAPIGLPDGAVATAGALADELLLTTPGKTLSYATDFADRPENRRRLIALARGSHTFICEASFMERDTQQATRTAHLTTRACAQIAEDAGVARLIPFHFSRRYEDDPQAVYEEIASFTARIWAPAPELLPEG